MNAAEVTNYCDYCDFLIQENYMHFINYVQIS